MAKTAIYKRDIAKAENYKKLLFSTSSTPVVYTTGIFLCVPKKKLGN